MRNILSIFLQLHLDHLGQWNNGKKEGDGSPVGEHGNGGHAPTERKPGTALNRSPRVPYDAL